MLLLCVVLNKFKFSIIACLPKVATVNTNIALQVLALYLAIFTIVKMEAFGLRLRRIVAAFCYYKVRQILFIIA